jgi:hypothetical protein
MAVEVSSYKEFLADRHDTNHAIKIFPKLPLGDIIEKLIPKSFLITSQSIL